MDQSIQASLSTTNSQSLLKLMSIESAMPSNHLIHCHPLLLPSIFPSIRIFSNELALIGITWPKYWSFSTSNEYSGLIFFRIDRFDVLGVQGIYILLGNLVGILDTILCNNNLMATLKKKFHMEVMRSPSLTPVPNAYGVSKMRGRK